MTTNHTNSPADSDVSFREDEAFAIKLDADDPLAHYRAQFHIPKQSNGEDVIYFAGNSLGLQPRTVRDLIGQELTDWAKLGVDGHFDSTRPWYSYHEIFRDTGARLVGAKPGEVVMMNSLTINLHLMMTTFFRPTKERFKIMMQSPAFPSDTYAVKSQLAFHGLDPAEALIILKPREDEHTIRLEDIEQTLAEQGDKIALVLFEGVNYFTGQLFEIEKITNLVKQHGCVMGWDLAHAAGNVPLKLHQWDVDFAVWCNYKYLNAGPGAVAGCFVHEKNSKNLDLHRLAGWWGNDPNTRFRMHLQPEFVPRPGAEGWQVSNPPILALAPVKASIDIFDEVGMSPLRQKSTQMTDYLAYLIGLLSANRFEIITPQPASVRGCQLSILAHERPRELHNALNSKGVVCDFREPNVIRVAPVPLYNTYHDAWRFAQVLARHVEAG